MSETEEIYDFQLIEFVKKGPKGKIRDIDCIPSTWVTFNSKKGKLETRFPEPPYNEKDNKLLRTLVKDKVAPPLGWPSYTIILRGHASKLIVQKLYCLNNIRYIYKYYIYIT